MHVLAAALLDLRSRFGLSIYANLFGVFFGGGGDAWHCPWKLVGTKAPGTVSTVGRITA